ncbi:TonB C-terminal domain-containing protein [Wohlfahrtiimonas chitiniclastica]|uniref:TonB C-terminal domain-containing protein n=1 Tax=Wohlfahrtiimonas chitiniclastica TaxID=400946 RepID=UPI001BCB373F|nr:TonB C-terminal domain-containing protein [Wohlfahrtiimonas chitiniclastica]MBS7814264.1 TonB C-terminal domain-containing protein [Wohlfahrtiimonas chitiniclastica]
MNVRPRSLMADIVSGVLTTVIVVGLGYLVYAKHDDFQFFPPPNPNQTAEPSDQAAAPKLAGSERIDEKQVENEMNRIAEEKRVAEEKRRQAEARRIAEEKRKAAEAEKKRLAEIAAKKKAEEEAKQKAIAAEKKRLEEIALKKKQAEEQKKKEEAERQKQLADQKAAEEKAAKVAAEKKRLADEKAKADKAAADKAAAEKKRIADEKAKADKAAADKAAAERKAKADAAAAAENDRIATAYLMSGGFLGAIQSALYSHWRVPTGSSGLTATIVFYVDAQGNITKIDDRKSKYSGNTAFDDSVKAAILRTGKIRMPDNQHAINKLVKEGIEVTFDPKEFF